MIIEKKEMIQIISILLRTFWGETKKKVCYRVSVYCYIQREREREREPLNQKQNISHHPLCFSKTVFARWERSRAYEKPMERSRIPPP